MGANLVTHGSRAMFSRALARTQTVKYLTWDAVQRLLRAAEGQTPTEQRDHMMLRIMAEAGPRRGELILLTVHSLDTAGERPYLLIPTEKKHKVERRGRSRTSIGMPIRKVPIRQELLGEILKFVHAHQDWLGPRGELFWGERGRPLDGSTVRKTVRKYAIKAGVDDPGQGLIVHPHTLRHSYGVWMLQNSVPITVLQDWMGHSSVLATMVYAKLAQADAAIFYDRVRWEGNMIREV